MQISGIRNVLCQFEHGSVRGGGRGGALPRQGTGEELRADGGPRSVVPDSAFTHWERRANAPLARTREPTAPTGPTGPPGSRQGAVRGPVCKEDRKRDPAAEGRPAAASHVLEGNAEVKGPAAGLHAGTGTRSAKACRTRARAHAHARARPALRCTITRAAAWAWQGGCRPGAAPSTAPPSSTKSHNRSFIQTIIPTFIEQSAAHSSVRTVSRRGPAVTTRATQLPPTPSTRL